MGGAVLKDNLLPIGKMASLNGLSINTLRLYDEKGLLKPRYTDPATGITASTKTRGWISSSI